MKVNPFNIILIFLNLIFWVLIVFGILCLIFLFLSSFWFVISYGFQQKKFETAGMLALYTVGYTISLFGICWLKRYIKNLANIQDGIETKLETLNFKEIIFWLSICLLLVFAAEIAIFWFYLLSSLFIILFNY